MLKLIERSPRYVAGYKAYCQEMHDAHITFFVPTDPKSIDDTWFERTKEWYDAKALGGVYHYWAVDGDEFIGEFQLRTQGTIKQKKATGQVDYSVKPSKWNQGYGKALLTAGIEIAKEKGLKAINLNINDLNEQSKRVVESLGAILQDKIPAYNQDEDEHILCRYWIEIVPGTLGQKGKELVSVKVSRVATNGGDGYTKTALLEEGGNYYIKVESEYQNEFPEKSRYQIKEAAAQDILQSVYAISFNQYEAKEGAMLCGGRWELAFVENGQKITVNSDTLSPEGIHKLNEILNKMQEQL